MANQAWKIQQNTTVSLKMAPLKAVTTPLSNERDLYTNCKMPHCAHHDSQPTRLSIIKAAAVQLWRPDSCDTWKNGLKKRNVYRWWIIIKDKLYNPAKPNEWQMTWYFCCFFSIFGAGSLSHVYCLLSLSLSCSAAFKACRLGPCHVSRQWMHFFQTPPPPVLLRGRCQQPYILGQMLSDKAHIRSFFMANRISDGI